MSAATLEKLTQLAEQLSTPQRRVSPMQLAAQLLEEALARVQAQTKANGNDLAALEHDLD